MVTKRLEKIHKQTPSTDRLIVGMIYTEQEQSKMTYLHVAITVQFVILSRYRPVATTWQGMEGADVTVHIF
jgi:hypothetical protein